ncbi:MAG: DNA gyrase subunit A, partial [Clostridia bacterium]|nr:DNA gyrase subunit A [Clostridia bacterium]
VQEGKENLMARFDFDEIQANHIVQMRLGQLTGLERLKIEEEMAALQEKIAEFLRILSSHENVLALVKEEALEVRGRYDDARRTEIVNVSGEVDIEDLIPEETCVLTMTEMGYIKRMAADEYNVQKKGGKGKIGITRREEDVVNTMFTCSTHDSVMFFTTKGKAYKIKGYEIPEGSRISKGMNLVNILPIESDEKVSAMIMIPKDAEDMYLCMCTAHGIIKRTELSAFNNIRKNGIIAINLDEGDILRSVKLTTGKNDLFVATRRGLGIRFNEEDARVIGRTARGVKAISFKYDDDCVVGMEILDEEKGGKVLTVSETGNGRKSDFSDYRVQTRGGFGSMNYRTEKYGLVCAVKVVYDDEDVILISSEGLIIRLAVTDIRECARPSKGVRVMRLGENDKVITLTSTLKSEDEPADALPDNPEDENEQETAQDEQ